MAAVLLELPPTHWVCPNCPAQAVTPGTVPNRFHACPALAGVLAPMVPAGTAARVRAVEREDYIGTQEVPVDANGRPVMSVITERPDGSNDTIAFAPTARLRIEG
jgi:hypothetical protein